MKSLTITLAAALCAAAATAQGPLWLRNTAISPDAGTIAFTFKGDIYTVPAAGGQARQLTANGAYNTAPVWSPDGSTIAYMSNRDGSNDIFVIPATGGTSRRLTTHSAGEQPLGWLNDSTILFTASYAPAQQAIQGDFAPQVYTVSTRGGRPRMFSSIPMRALSVNPADGSIIYQDIKGFENRWRKHERSSGTADIWRLADGRHVKLTSFNGHDLEPVWTGADTYVYLSEQDNNNLNVYAGDLTGKNRRLTSFERHPVRSLSAAKNGTLAFSYDGEIYTMTPGGQPAKVAVSIVGDDYDSDWVGSTRSSGASYMVPSPKGKEVAFVIRGDVYTTSVEYPTTRRITNTPGQERVLSVAPDGRSMVYDSERDGLWQLFITRITDPDAKQFTYAKDIEEELLYKADKAAQQPMFSPDGKKVAFLEDRTTLRVIDVDTKNVVTALDGKYNYSYSDGDISFQWSPDSRWLLVDYIGNGGWNNSDIAMVAADGSKVIDLTESGYSDYNPRWALNGEAVTWQSTKYGMKSHASWGAQGDVMFMALTPEALDKIRLTEEEAKLAEEKKKDDEEQDVKDDLKKDKKKKDKKDKKDKADKEKTTPAIDYDFDNRHIRTVRLTPMSGVGDYILSKDGDKLYYLASDHTLSTNLMVLDLREGEAEILAKNVRGGFEPDADLENIFVFSGSGFKKIALADGTVKGIEYEAEYDRHPSLERQYMFDHMLTQVRDKFYDRNLHGIDWEGLGKDYRKFLPYINNNEDFAILLSEILGELNASHTGGRHYGGSQYATGNLGIFTDPDYTGDGIMVTEAVAGGPLATAKAGIKPGDVITAIDGKPVKAGADYNPMLRDKAGKRVRLTVNGNRDIEVKPISDGRFSDLLYKRWVRRNQAMVDSLSGGRIGYVHVEGMDDASFRTVYSQLLGKYRNCEAVIVDTRWNGGGWLHNDIAQLLGGKAYLDWMPRGQYIGTEPYSQWTKPSVMLVNESNYSDAHGTPWVYKTLNIGKLVGAPVPGTMTAVWWERQIDPSIVFGIPQVTSVDKQGNVLENRQLNPDIEVYNRPELVEQGRDQQIEAAVKSLLDQLGK